MDGWVLYYIVFAMSSNLYKHFNNLYILFSVNFNNGSADDNDVDGNIGDNADDDGDTDDGDGNIDTNGSKCLYIKCKCNVFYIILQLIKELKIINP
jgi:hypothetical protein